jgi:glycosyltransferase involved in cell wall biosynthesis
VDPAYGGPAHSVSRTAAALADVGVDVGLWAEDQSVWSTSLLPRDTALRRLRGSAGEALITFGRTDLLHDNGIWLPYHHQLSMLASKQGIPRLISTRGMLEPWAVQHKRFKKHIAWHLYQRRDLRYAQLLHATAVKEAVNLERFRLGVPIRVIPNGVDLPELRPVERAARDAGRRTALFLGRICPVKGLLMLIEAWAQVRPSGWRLRIAGPDEAGHREEIERRVFAAGLNDLVSFAGSLEGEAKRDGLFDADLLVLPSHSESFGMVVAEALAHAVPVLTTTATPWSALKERGCGWCVAPSPEALAEGLRQATSRDLATLRAMGAKGRTFVSAQFGWDAVANQLVATYEQAIAARRRDW